MSPTDFTRLPRRRDFLFASTGLAMLSLPGCGGALGAETANVRVSNATVDYSSIDIYVDGEKVASGLSNGGTTSDWSEVEASDQQVSLAEADSSTTRLSEAHQFDENSYTTILAYGTLAQAMKLRYFDELTENPGANQARVRFFAASSALGALDVYVTNEESLNSVSPTFQLAGYEALTQYVAIESGTWRIRLTSSGNAANVLYDLAAAVSIASESCVTFAVVPRASGSLPDLVAWAERDGSVVLSNELA